jgi:hypothetical protein
MSEVAKPLSDDEIEPVDEDDGPVEETKRAVSGFTPTQNVSWPGDASPPREPESGAAQAHHITRGQHAKVNKVLDAREEAEKARVEDHRFDPGTSIEARGDVAAELKRLVAEQRAQELAEYEQVMGTRALTAAVEKAKAKQAA